MEPWGWLVAYVVGFGLLQLLLFKYFRGDDPAPDATPGRAEGSASGRLESSPDEPGEGGVHCRHCGTYNEPTATITYCKECVEPLR